MPQVPQFAPSLRVSTQRPLQQSRPEPQALVALHAAVQVPLMHTLPAAHCVSSVQLWQEWFGRHTPEGQSVPVLQPRSQVKSVRQYWPIGHMSAAPGRHWTQRLLAVSHFGVTPPHCASVVHCTHWPVAEHTCPIGHGWFALQPFTQTFDWQTWPRGHCGSFTHATHVFVAGLQNGLPGVVQSPSITQPTQVFVAGLHTGSPGRVHCAFVVQVTQRPAVASHMSPDGQTGCWAEQPGTHALF